MVLRFVNIPLRFEGLGSASPFGPLEARLGSSPALRCPLRNLNGHRNTCHALARSVTGCVPDPSQDIRSSDPCSQETTWQKAPQAAVCLDKRTSVVTPSHLAILGEADDEALSKDLHRMDASTAATERLDDQIGPNTPELLELPATFLSCCATSKSMVSHEVLRRSNAPPRALRSLESLHTESRVRPSW